MIRVNARGSMGQAAIIRGHQQPAKAGITTKVHQWRDENETCRDRISQRPTGRAGAHSWSYRHLLGLW